MKKMIILSPFDYNARSNSKAILTLEEISGKLTGNIRCFNIKAKEKLLGVKIGDNFSSFKFQGNEFEFDIATKCKLTSASSVILDADNLTEIIAGGSTETSKIWQQSIKAMMSNSKENEYHTEMLKIKEKLDKKEKVNEDVADDSKEDTENAKLSDIKHIGQQDENSTQNDLKFYNSIKSQIEKLLSDYPKDRVLEEILPYSQFVSIPASSGSDYVFGVIYQDNTPKFICYGERKASPEQDKTQFEDYYQWLPLDADNPDSEGYYMAYQDANSGENIELTIF